MPILARSSAFSRVTALAEQRPLHEAFRWLHLHGQQMIRWQTELIAIPAPPFGEELRSKWMEEQFRLAGLAHVTVDSLGNVFGEFGQDRSYESSELEPVAFARKPVVFLSAHLDTVFPLTTPLEITIEDDLIRAPGACDNAAGVIGMLAIANALVQSQMPLNTTLVFVGNVGEEGEGNLRGVRRIYQDSVYAGQIAAHVVLDGAGAETAVTQALGSRRYQVTIQGPGGHSFSDAGTPNPILVMAAALHRLADQERQRYSREIEAPRTTMNVGTIVGGTSVNSIPESATATLDFRSTDLQQLVRLEVALHRAIEDAVEAANLHRKSELKSNGTHSRTAKPLSFSVEKIGDRPAAELPSDSPLLEAIKAVDRHLGLRTDLRLGSTDANIPLSLGVPAVSLGAGGEGGGAHTRAEWYSAKNRELGLRRIMLLVLTMLELVGKQV